MAINVVEILSERGLLAALTDEAIGDVTREPTVVYAGFDPSSDSLQIGNLVAILGLAHFQRCGHRVIAVVGGATGLVGDPSGKTADRDLLTEEEVEHNLVGIRENLSRFLDFDHPTTAAKILNNNDWMREFTFVRFLREVGCHFRLGQMLSKESVKARLAGEAGMSFAEFSYQLLQGYDFLRLYDDEGCRVQIGGSDQWGNITAGIDLIRRTRSETAYGLTFPLVCDSSGQKFGKSEGNALYLDSRKTSFYEFYQFFIRTTDEDVIRFLKLFTFLPMEQIEELERRTVDEPEKREAQRVLAEELTRAVHGDEGLETAKRASSVLFGGEIAGLRADELMEVFADVPSTDCASNSVVGAPIVTVVADAGLCRSKGEARRLVSSGGLYINNVRVASVDAVVGEQDVIDGRIVVMRSGKKRFHLIRIL